MGAGLRGRCRVRMIGTGAGAEPMPCWWETAVDDLLSIASAALGAELTGPVDLGGSGRSTVLRCRAASAGMVVVKSCGPRSGPGRDHRAAQAGRP